MNEVPGLIGKKLGMTQVFSEDGSSIPVTVVEAGPCRVTQVKTKQVEGYDAVQLGFDPKKKSRTSKPLMGHFSASKSEPYRMLREFRINDPSAFEVGEEIKADSFQVGIKVNVEGTSVGKGFLGVIKRHGFSFGPKTHGSNSHAEPGSIGGSAYPGRVWPGQKLPGRTGGERVTIRNISVVGVDPERNLVLLRGAVPGKRNSYLLMKPVPGTEPSAKKESAAPEAEKEKGKGKK